MAVGGGNPLLSCRSVSKHFGAMAALKDLSFDIQTGEIFGIGGPNGAGKTTLFEVISGLDPADAGEVVFDGRIITNAPPQHICHLGIARIFQSNTGFNSLTVRENVLIGAVYGHSNSLLPPLAVGADASERADRALATVGLQRRAGDLTANLPVLDRKLLMIASALASGPKLLLMDEPVGGLTPQEIDRVMALVRRLADEGITLILIEHVMRFMVQLATRVMILHHGEKIYEGSPGGLVRDQTVAQVYLGDRTAARLANLLEKA